MKNVKVLMMALVAIPLLLASCHPKKQVTKDTKPAPADSMEQVAFLQKVSENVSKSQFVTSKLKFTVEYGPQQVTLTGNLKMKRDDVIRLQLMAFGFVEAGRLEFTKDYVLIMDRINKQYLKAPWMSIDFLRNSGLNFNTLQALFWNQLFMPNLARSEKISADSLASFSTIESGDDMIISLEEGKMDYSWLASKQTALIKMANILYKDRFNGNTQLNWDYDQFEKLNKTAYPKKHAITLTTPEKEVKLGMTLNYIGAETEWEPRTEISNKYREVTVDEILRRFMAL